jgi:DNA-binding MarR family transcriptional regulator
MIRNRSTVKVQPGLFLQPFVVAQLSGSIVVDVVEGSEVTAPEYAVTSWIPHAASATPSELAADLGLAPTTLSAMIDRLVRKGQVRRVRHPEDGRSYVLELTAAGKRTNQRNSRRLSEAIERLRAELDADPEEILGAMRLLEDALRRVLEDPA